MLIYLLVDYLLTNYNITTSFNLLVNKVIVFFQIDPRLAEQYQRNDSNNNFDSNCPIYPQPFYPRFISASPTHHFNLIAKESIPLGYNELKPTYIPHSPPLPNSLPLAFPLPPPPIPIEPPIENCNKFVPKEEPIVKKECVNPGDSFKVEALLKDDVKFEDKQEKLKPFKCQDCGKCFSQLRNYKYHR